ncbi:hypothetical protein TRIUR3_22089 [Triticum urartu]|uniref:Uncharacterized protein n=1 Tax=Triticum urartu TaxID=4572 RepID=M7YNN0_TRIUA|nr:hypothetical protein TRIUR3_22089 [Triticum urartu]
MVAAEARPLHASSAHDPRENERIEMQGVEERKKEKGGRRRCCGEALEGGGGVSEGEEEGGGGRGARWRPRSDLDRDLCGEALKQRRPLRGIGVSFLAGQRVGERREEGNRERGEIWG